MIGFGSSLLQDVSCIIHYTHTNVNRLWAIFVIDDEMKIKLKYAIDIKIQFVL